MRKLIEQARSLDVVDITILILAVASVVFFIYAADYALTVTIDQ